MFSLVSKRHLRSSDAKVISTGHKMRYIPEGRGIFILFLA